MFMCYLNYLTSPNIHMAVQPQYHSNVVFFNRTSVEEGNGNGNDYSSLHRGILQQSQLQVGNKKRGREDNTVTTTPANTDTEPDPVYSFISMRTQNNPFNPNTNVVSTGLRLAFQDQQQIQISDEIEQFLQTQVEQLRRTLADERQRHYRALVVAAEESATRRLREKEVEVEKAARRNAELETRVAQLRMEAQVWQSRVREQESAAAALQAQLQHAIVSGECARKEMEGGLGCAMGGGIGADDAESAYVDPDRVEGEAAARVPGCRACNRRVATVVVLPCRHLSVCRECDGVVEACPFCLSYRSSSVEVFLF